MAVPKILLVDDEGLMLALYKAHVERGGYQMLTAKSGEEGIETASRELPDLIVMDVIMTGMSGLAALRELKTREATKAIPIIIITAAAHTTTRKEAEMGGAIRFLTKPISPLQFLAEIGQVVPLPETKTGK